MLPCARSWPPRPSRTRRNTTPWCPPISPAPSAAERRRFPDDLNLSFRKQLNLRYGENPHQQAAFYTDPRAIGTSVTQARQIQGKELSYNNIADADSALECVRQFDMPGCVIVKHANPCGAARAASIAEAYARAYRTDPTSAFGGVIAFNRELDAATARAILDQQFVEVILAPGVSEAAQALLAQKDNVRVLQVGDLTFPVTQLLEYKSVAGGLLVQTRDTGVVRAQELRAVTRRVPTLAELDDLIFAWRIAKYVKSNAIVCVKDKATVGIGAGQMSRVVSSKIAALKAQDAGLDMQSASIASDAYFPFRDGLDARGRTRRQIGDPARRLEARRGSHRRGRRARHRDGVHRNAPLSSLSKADLNTERPIVTAQTRSRPGDAASMVS